MATSLVDRFWSKVDQSGECWEWRGGRSGNGYGLLQREEGSRYAHRIAWELANGPIPEGMMVCHHCDNRLCVRLGHLFLGDAAANQADMVVKGRSLRGARHNLAVLTESDILEIRRLWAVGGITQPEIALRFNTTKGNISQIVRGKKWQHLLPDDWQPPVPRQWSRAA